MRCQQDELYEAESRALAALDLPRLTLAEAQAMVDRWRDTDWWRRDFRAVRYVELRPRTDGRASVSGWLPAEGVGVCEMASVHLNGLYVAHEVTHVLAAARYGSGGTHDPWYARTYLQLAYVGLGSGVYKALYDEMVAGDIDHVIDE